MTGMVQMDPVVVNREGRVVTNSQDVAEAFGKRHDHVLRDVDNLLENIAPQNWGAMFVLSEEFDARANRVVRSFNMTRNGFTLLAMGFNGKKALEFKLRYIQAFNAMEEAMRSTAVPVDMKAIGGMVKGIVAKAMSQAVSEMVPDLVRVEIAASDRAVTTEFRPASSVLEQMKLEPKERRGLSTPISKRLMRHAAANADRFPAVRECPITGRYMFHVDLIRDWLVDSGGSAYVAEAVTRRRSKVTGQHRLRLVVPENRPTL